MDPFIDHARIMHRMAEIPSIHHPKMQFKRETRLINGAGRRTASVEMSVVVMHNGEEDRAHASFDPTTPSPVTKAWMALTTSPPCVRSRSVALTLDISSSSIYIHSTHPSIRVCLSRQSYVDIAREGTKRCHDANGVEVDGLTTMVTSTGSTLMDFFLLCSSSSSSILPPFDFDDDDDPPQAPAPAPAPPSDV